MRHTLEFDTVKYDLRSTDDSLEKLQLNPPFCSTKTTSFWPVCVWNEQFSIEDKIKSIIQNETLFSDDSGPNQSHKLKIEAIKAPITNDIPKHSSIIVIDQLWFDWKKHAQWKRAHMLHVVHPSIQNIIKVQLKFSLSLFLRLRIAPNVMSTTDWPHWCVDPCTSKQRKLCKVISYIY